MGSLLSLFLSLFNRDSRDDFSSCMKPRSFTSKERLVPEPDPFFHHPLPHVSNANRSFPPWKYCAQCVALPPPHPLLISPLNKKLNQGDWCVRGRGTPDNSRVRWKKEKRRRRRRRGRSRGKRFEKRNAGNEIYADPGL